MNNQNQVNAVIGLGIDPQKAQQAVTLINDMRKGFDDAHKQADQFVQGLHKVEEEGRKLREVGATMTGLGGSILGGLTLVANKYAEAYKGLEPQANAFNAALAKQTQATDDLGRVAASSLTPLFNQVAQFEEKVTQFASAHPELVQAAVGVGAGLAAGGAALIAAGTAITTVARAAELLKGALGGSGISSLAGGVATAAVGVAALSAGAVIAAGGLNKIGEATNNQYLAAYNLTDTLKTIRQLLAGAALGISTAFVEAKKTLAELGGAFVGISTLIVSKIAEAMDDLATGIRKGIITIQQVIAEFEADLLSGIQQFLDNLGIHGADKTLLQGQIGAANQYNALGDQAKAEDTGLKARQDKRDADLKKVGDGLGQFANQIGNQYKTDQQNLAKSADAMAKFADTGSLGSTIDNAIGKIGDTISKAIGGATSPTTIGAGISPDIVNAFIDRQKKIASSEQNFNIEIATLNTDRINTELKARRDLQAQLAQQVVEETNQRRQSTENYQAEQTKALNDFNFSEAQIREKAAFDRLQKERQLQFQLTDLAAAGDVAGFVQAERAHVFETNQQKSQDAFDKQQRQEKFNQESADRYTTFQKELSDQAVAAEQRRQQTLTQFATEEADRKVSYQQQLDALKLKHRQELTEIDRAFAEQVASISSNNNYLQAIQQQFYGQMNQAAAQFVQTQQGYLTSLYTQTLPNFVQNQSGIQQSASPTGYYGPNGQAPTNPFPSFDVGTPYVKRDMLAYIHKGERIIPANQNSANSPVNIVINNTVGDIVTKKHLDDAQEAIVSGVKLAFRTAGGFA